MKAYKLMKLRKDGTLGSLFINAKATYPLGKWLKAECLPTKGFQVREGWHCCFEMNAPHLKEDLKSGEHRVWVEVEVEDYYTYDRPESQGGAWILADKMKIIGIVEKGA
jgi:hypothetical protein